MDCTKMIIKKFGGTSLANIEKIGHVADLVGQAWQSGQRCAVVVSAMAGTTNQLLDWANNISDLYSLEKDVVASAGEQITAGLLAMALKSRGIQARSWMGWQLPIRTNAIAGEAEILSIDTAGLIKDFACDVLPVIAGFQGINEQNQITTLGRGGSDTTAVVLASHLGASVCQIFTDVNGVYTADPSYVTMARPYPTVCYDDMFSLAEHGAKVLHAKAVRRALECDVPLQVLSTFALENQGTWIQKKAEPIRGITQKTVWSFHIPSLCAEKLAAAFF